MISARARSHLGEAVAVSLAFLGMLAALHLCSGCAGANSPEAQKAKEDAAGGAYLAEHMWCVERFNTDPEIDACRAAVRRRWGISETATRKDGGQ